MQSWKSNDQFDQAPNHPDPHRHHLRGPGPSVRMGHHIPPHFNTDAGIEHVSAQIALLAAEIAELRSEVAALRDQDRL